MNTNYNKGFDYKPDVGSNYIKKVMTTAVRKSKINPIMPCVDTIDALLDIGNERLRTKIKFFNDYKNFLKESDKEILKASNLLKELEDNFISDDIKTTAKDFIGVVNSGGAVQIITLDELKVARRLSSLKTIVDLFRKYSQDIMEGENILLNKEQELEELLKQHKIGRRTKALMRDSGTKI